MTTNYETQPGIFLMIVEAQIINLPYSGQYEERIYDIPSSSHSSDWTYVKFTMNDCTEWCAHFRGAPINVVLSMPLQCSLVLTSDCLYKLDLINANIIDTEVNPEYQNMTVMPSGEFIFSDYYHLYRMGESIKDREPIDSPVSMDKIQFEGWSGNKLKFTCDEFFNWNNRLEMELDGETFEIVIRKDS